MTAGGRIVGRSRQRRALRAWELRAAQREHMSCAGCAHRSQAAALLGLAQRMTQAFAGWRGLQRSPCNIMSSRSQLSRSPHSAPLPEHSRAAGRPMAAVQVAAPFGCSSTAGSATVTTHHLSLTAQQSSNLHHPPPCMQSPRCSCASANWARTRPTLFFAQPC